jgi:hypothetical protein
MDMPLTLGLFYFYRNSEEPKDLNCQGVKWLAKISNSSGETPGMEELDKSD